MSGRHAPTAEMVEDELHKTELVRDLQADQISISTPVMLDLAGVA